jgi:hypothetical protein
MAANVPFLTRPQSCTRPLAEVSTARGLEAPSADHGHPRVRLGAIVPAALCCPNPFTRLTPGGLFVAVGAIVRRDEPNPHAMNQVMADERCPLFAMCDARDNSVGHVHSLGRRVGSAQSELPPSTLSGRCLRPFRAHASCTGWGSAPTRFGSSSAQLRPAVGRPAAGSPRSRPSACTPGLADGQGFD